VLVTLVVAVRVIVLDVRVLVGRTGTPSAVLVAPGRTGTGTGTVVSGTRPAASEVKLAKGTPGGSPSAIPRTLLGPMPEVWKITIPFEPEIPVATMARSWRRRAGCTPEMRTSEAKAPEMSESVPASYTPLPLLSLKTKAVTLTWHRLNDC
jgi:hypothetical protein